MIKDSNKYNSAIVFSGGGTRFTIYCGMYAALCELGKKPDIIIGACGGAVATTIIKSFTDIKDQKLYTQSRELYEFVKNTTLTKDRYLSKIGLFTLKKIFNKLNAPIYEDVFNRYLVDINQDISTELPSLAVNRNDAISTIIIGSQILIDPSRVNTYRNGKKIYKKVLFTDTETALRLNQETIAIKSKNYIESAVDPSVKIITNVPNCIAMRISLSDMFYVKPVFWNNNYYAGGAIDLLPVELAKHIADNVIMEKKKGYNLLEESLVRSVLGYSGNKRLEEVYSQHINHWIDTSDIKTKLKNHYCQRKTNWLKLRIDMKLPKSYDQFCEDMEIQWQYGYDKIMKEVAL